MIQPLVSIVMPIWGVARYVKRSFSSVLEQTYPNIQYIIVDDATPDNSMEIVSDIIKLFPDRKDAIEIVTHRLNKGLAAARKSGLSHACGDYVLLLDSDDYFEPDMVAEMVASALQFQSDIVLCDYLITYQEYERYVRQNFSGTGWKLCECILTAQLQGFSWNKLIKRSLFVDHKIEYIEGLNMWEDISVIPRICCFAKNVHYLPKAFAHYNQQNINSYSNTLSKKSIENIVSVVEIIKDFFVLNPSLEISPAVLEQFELRAKLYYLLYTKGKYRKQLNCLYPETKTICFRRRLHPVYSNMIHIAAYFKFYFLIDLMWLFINRLKMIVIKFRK